MEDIIVEEVEPSVFQDLYLKADSEDALMAALADSGVSDYSIDIIGVIYKQTGETVLEDGTIMPEVSMIDGFHANLRGSFTETQKAKLPLIEAPATPMRVWA
jgi:hypothetical protein